MFRDHTFRSMVALLLLICPLVVHAQGDELCISISGIEKDFGVAGLTGISLHVGLDSDEELTDPIAVSLAYQRQLLEQIAELEAILEAERKTYEESYVALELGYAVRLSECEATQVAWCAARELRPHCEPFISAIPDDCMYLVDGCCP